jgi:ligand-binding sensor domain-containing protein
MDYRITVSTASSETRVALCGLHRRRLSRFDGYTFTNYGVDQGLPHRGVTDFLETRDGQFWLGTHGGLVRFNHRAFHCAESSMQTMA